MDVAFFFGHITEYTEKMIKVFNADIHDLCKEGDAAFEPYIREHKISSDVDVITRTVTSSVRASVSATVSAGRAMKLPPEELKSFRIDTVIPDFASFPLMSMDVYENEPVFFLSKACTRYDSKHAVDYLQLLLASYIHFL
jgi:hypothetical protein